MLLCVLSSITILLICRHFVVYLHESMETHTQLHFSVNASQNIPADIISGFLKIFPPARDQWRRSFPFCSDMYT